ncbi:snoRNA binding protein [Aureococcus anophagefferens]|uniref:SnoRNA binding protein n=1 Tax=Aureococcus anophagefferens TaxID=44056 RepID=A0ABR1G6U2_AURAN
MHISVSTCGGARGSVYRSMDGGARPKARLGLLATASKDKTCRVWELRDGVYETRAVLVGHVDAVGAVALGLDAAGPFAVSASHHRTLKRWPFDVAQPRAAASVVAHDKDAHCVAVAPKGKLVASCAGDMTAKLWDPATLELRGALAGHKRGVWRCAFSATERWLATCSSDKTVKVWAVASLQCLATLQGHEDSVLALAFIGGDQLASGSADGVLKVWSPKTSTCECTVEAHAGAKCWSLAASPATANRPAALASGGGDGALRRFVDCSAGDADRARDEAEVLVEREQALRDALFKRDYGKALAEALRLDRPHTAWTALRDPPKRATGAAVDDPYDGVVAAWDLATARKCLGFAAEWNTNATRAPVAQRVRRAVVKRFGADAALGDAVSRDALAAYTRRHRVRLDGLSRQTYLIDASLGAIGRRDARLLAAEAAQRAGPVLSNRAAKRARDNPAPAAAPDAVAVSADALFSGGDDDDDDSDAPPPPKKSSAKKKKKKKKKKKGGGLVCFVSLASDGIADHGTVTATHGHDFSRASIARRATFTDGLAKSRTFGVLRTAQEPPTGASLGRVAELAILPHVALEVIEPRPPRARRLRGRPGPMTKEPKRERESSEESSEDDQDDEVLVEDDDLHPLNRPIKVELTTPPRCAFYCAPVSEADAANLARECAEVGRGLPPGALRAAGPFSFGVGVIPRGVLESETRLDGDHSVVKAAGAYFEKNEKYLENERKKIRVLHGADVDPQAPVSAQGAVPVAKAILDMTRRDRQYAARVFKNTRANHSEIKAFFDCALKGLPFDLALRTTIKACPRCQAFFNLIMASVQAHVPAPARLCPEVPSACDHPSVMTAEGLIVLANWPPRPT